MAVLSSVYKALTPQFSIQILRGLGRDGEERREEAESGGAHQ